ncbi:MAG TPA: prephenate dehydratase [Microthrixaceae bacterium]|nr:prephenate dehydratase [Microthrixaceae bacterium]
MTDHARTTGSLDARRVAFLGPVGTFTEQAMLREADLAAAEMVPMATMADVLFAVNDGDVDLGVVPIENAIEGTVNATIDTLAFDVDLVIQRELVEPVSLHLLVQPGAPLSGIKVIHSIPVAAAQCRAWLREHVPGAELRAANSTAEAAETCATLADPTVAAIANARAAQVYGLELGASDIESHPENRTRFVVVARSGIPVPTGHDKTSIVVYQRADRPGSLVAILQEFSARSINLTLLHSRPTKTSLGDYCFLLELDGHVADEVVADCLRTLRASQGDVKFLGSYPAAGAEGPAQRARVDAAQQAAGDWMTALRSQIDG